MKDFQEMKEEVSEVKKVNDDLKRTVKSMAEKIKEYDFKFEQQEREKKKANISIKGVLEIQNLSLEKLVNDLFEDLNLEYKVQDLCNKIYRKGKYVSATAGNMPKPRSVIIQFYEESIKYEIFKNLKNMAGKEKWKNIFVNEDLTADQVNKMKDMRAINGYTKSVGMDTRIKGTKLFIEGKKINLDDLYTVPEKISIEKAKTIEFNVTVIFQGHHIVSYQIWQNLKLSTKA